jgi:hypothetical protein
MAKLYSLMVMSAGSGEDVYNTFRAAYKWVKNDVRRRYPNCVFAKRVPTPKYSEVISFYLGRESNSVSEHFDHHWSEVEVFSIL